MASTTTPNQRLTLYKAKGPGWKEAVRTQKMRRLQAQRMKLVGNLRLSVIVNNQLEEDLQLERELLEEQLESEYQLSFHTNEDHLAEHPCPTCGQELEVMHGFQPRAIRCETCDYSTQFFWDDFQARIDFARRQHSNRGCPQYAEFLSLERELFIACEACDYLEAAT